MSGAAFDRRRFNGPETAAPLRKRIAVSQSGPASSASRPNKAARLDQRADHAVRPIFLKTGLITQASGSAYIETGSLKLICSVYGPHPTRRDVAFNSKATLNTEVRFAPFALASRRRVPGKETESSHLSAKLEQALLPSLRLDLLPKSVIDLFVMVLECDGPEVDVAASITAASVALAQAGVEMFGLVIASSAVIYSDRILLDPTATECDQADDDSDVIGLVSLASLPALGTVTNISIQGRIPRTVAKQALAKLNDACAQIHTVAAKALLSSTADA